jgi:hypothetical protein
MRSTFFRRAWTAAAALVAVALAASLPAPTFAHGSTTRLTAATGSPARVVGTAGFDTLVLPLSTPMAGPAVVGGVQAAASVAAAPAAHVRVAGAARHPRAGIPSPATGSGTWAFIVGINDYPGTHNDLFAGVNDAMEVQRAVLQMGARSDQVRTVLDGQATADAIRGGLDWLTANAGPDAVAVFFYAGHAVKVDADTEAMVGADMGEIRDTELADRLAGLAARHAWLGIAGCYGGGFTEALGPGRVLTGAAPANGLAYENSRFGRSYMVEYMVHQAMVEGRAAPSVQAAFAYAADAIARDYPGRAPVQFDESDGNLDLRPPADTAPTAPPPPSPPSQDSAGTPPTTTTTTTTPPPPRHDCMLGRVCN